MAHRILNEIIQPEDDLCGQACVTMLAGVTIAEAISGNSLKSQGGYSKMGTGVFFIGKGNLRKGAGGWYERYKESGKRKGMACGSARSCGGRCAGGNREDSGVGGRSG